jgi:hypothetical protein
MLKRLKKLAGFKKQKADGVTNSLVGKQALFTMKVH